MKLEVRAVNAPVIAAGLVFCDTARVIEVDEVTAAELVLNDQLTVVTIETQKQSKGRGDA